MKLRSASAIPKKYDMVEEDDDEKSDYKCGWKSCNRYFNSIKGLAQHMNNSHIPEEGNTLYKCHWNGCTRQGNPVNARHRMLIHIRSHTHEKRHGCDDCGKTFSRLENLRTHMRSHTGDKPYACSVAGCDKAYSSSSERFKHSKTHKEDKPYVCRVEGCNKRYTHPSSLRKHMKSTVHTIKREQMTGLTTQLTGSKHRDIQTENSYPGAKGIADKPYACKVEGCNKRYTDPSSLRKHKRVTLHGREPNNSTIEMVKAVKIECP